MNFLLFFLSCRRGGLIGAAILLFQRRAERIAQMRDDPYYLVDDPPPRTTTQLDDVDSIPIVRLDDIPSPEESEYGVPSLALHVPFPYYVDELTSILHCSTKGRAGSRVSPISVIIHFPPQRFLNSRVGRSNR